MRPLVALCLAFASDPAVVFGFVPSADLASGKHGASRCRIPRCSPHRPLHVLFSSSSESPAQPSNNCPDFVTSPVLRQVYTAMMQNIQQFGHPNIPLGTTAGKQCKALRRLAFQNKLSSEEVELLESLGFRFNSFDDVYEEADFDDCLSRLVEYERINQTGYQIPKKYKEDPELGAWVTMIRRIGRDGIEKDRRKRLDDIGFAWVSTRKCGSSFMKNYRQIRDAIAAAGEADGGGNGGGGGGGFEAVKKDEAMMKWLKAQAEAAAKGNLSQERMEYLDKLPLSSGDDELDWRNL